MLREEIRQQERLDYEHLTRMPILDSFIKESVRLNPLDKSRSYTDWLRIGFSLILQVAIRRKALRPYTFSHGGPHVALGEIACVPAWEIMHNETNYPRANEFDGLRFVPNSTFGKPEREISDQRGTTFTDASKDFPIWGLGSKVW